MRKVLLPVIAVLSVFGISACKGSPPACAASLTVNEIAAQHGTFVSYVTKGGGGGGGGGHSSGGGSHAPSNSGSHSGGGKAPSNSGSHSNTVSGSRASSYHGPTTVSHTTYVFHSSGHSYTYHHLGYGYYNGIFGHHYVWSPGAWQINNDPYNPYNYDNPYSPYYHVRLASC